MTTLTDLRALALAATPGPWVQHPDGWTVRRVVAQDASQRGWRVAYTYASGPDRVEQEVADAAYIAACFPERVLAMIVCIEAAKALEAEASKRLRFRDAERYPELCAALTEVRTALAKLEQK